MKKYKSTNPMIQKYLDEVYEKLPEWLKEKEQECYEILQELEEHIWDKAEEKAQGQTVSEQQLRMAMEILGSPQKIASEYKKRGTPKIYITEELFPYYKQTLIFFGAIFSVLSIVGNLFSIGKVSALELVISILQGIFDAWITVFLIGTIVWVALSMEGYLPEDIGIKDEKTLSFKTHTHNENRKELKPAGFIASGIFEMIIGFVFVIQPFGILASYFPAEFAQYIAYSGVLTIIEGFLTLGRGFVGKKNAAGHRLFMGLVLGVKIGEIYLLVCC